jgi:hypothetical protein
MWHSLGAMLGRSGDGTGSKARGFSCAELGAAGGDSNGVVMFRTDSACKVLMPKSLCR